MKRNVRHSLAHKRTRAVTLVSSLARNSPVPLFYAMLIIILLPPHQTSPSQSLFILSSPSPLSVLSGRTAATSSISLNCHGKRAGYKNGLRSNLMVIVRTIRFRVVSRRQGRHLMSIPCILKEKLFDFLRNLNRSQHLPPLIHQLRKHTIRSTFLHLPEPAKDGEFIVGHAHVCFVGLDVGGGYGF